jgi:GTP cyclohydrolase I
MLHNNEDINNYVKENFAQYDVKSILEFIGENVDREGLKDTPKRYIKFLQEFLNPQKFEMTSFNSEGMNEMVIVKDIQFYSLCEHHLAPFFGIASIAYIPNGRIVGISKLPRLVDHYSRRLQNQERITSQVAEHLMDATNAIGVAVVLNARHMCMEMRGIKASGANTTTSKMLGVFSTDVNARQEFLNLIK